MSNLKIEGKVGDFCLNCKNCKAVTRMHDGETASIRLTEVECEDPYDGMAKTLDADGDICCSMFEPKPPCEKSERFDRTYCHGPNGTITISYKAVFGEPVNCPSYEEKKEKEPCDKISCLQHELEMDKLRMKTHQLEKEKVAHMKGIERLKKSQEGLQNQVKNLLSENREKDKKNSELRARVKYWSNIATNNADLAIKNKKDRDKWRELYNSLSELFPEYDKLHKEECEKKYRDEISKLQNIVTEKEVEIKGLRKDNVRLNKDISWGNMIAEKNTELNQTISDQEVTIKALLITIKEMCKEDETNE